MYNIFRKCSLWVDIVNISCYKPVNLVSWPTFGVLRVPVLAPVLLVIEAELARSLGPHRDQDDEDE